MARKNQSKEMGDIIAAIDRFYDKYKGDVVFHCSFIAFGGKDGDIVEDAIFGYGHKESLILSLKDTLDIVKKEKKQFINW